MTYSPDEREGVPWAMQVVVRVEKDPAPDHLAVLRPHCWLMVGHCGGLRQSQTIGDYVLAHGYMRRDRILDELLPPEVPLPALAEVQLALQAAAATVTGEQADALKQRLRTGTVVTYDDRNWELRFSQERRRINLSRSIAVDSGDFDVVGVWKPVGAPFVCIEPWRSVPTPEGWDGDIVDKPRQFVLAPGAQRAFSYSITLS